MMETATYGISAAFWILANRYC